MRKVISVNTALDLMYSLAETEKDRIMAERLYNDIALLKELIIRGMTVQATWWASECWEYYTWEAQ